MKDTQSVREEGESLINALLGDYPGFEQRGGAGRLHELYCDGLAIDTLRPLLSSESLKVKRAAIFVASELGEGGRELLDDVIPLIADVDILVSSQALEVVALTSRGPRAGEFAHVVQALEAQSSKLRVNAMDLVSSAPMECLRACLSQTQPNGRLSKVHRWGLDILVNVDELAPREFLVRLNDHFGLNRKYAAMAARRIFHKDVAPMKKVADSSDPELQVFGSQVLEMYLRLGENFRGRVWR